MVVLEPDLEKMRALGEGWLIQWLKTWWSGRRRVPGMVRGAVSLLMALTLMPHVTLNKTWTESGETTSEVFCMVTGAWAPHRLPRPQALQAQEQTPSSLFPPALGRVYLQDSWANQAPRPRHSSAQPGRCRLVRSFDLGHCCPSAKKGLK